MTTFRYRSAARSSRTTIVSAAATLTLCLAVSTAAQGQKRGGARGGEESPTFQAYRGIQLGMTADEVRSKLGTPKDKSSDQDFFVFNETESAQIVYDKSQKVVTISADFLTGGKAPTPKDVFGADLEAKPDGSMYKMVRYSKAGCWISYNRTAGNSPLTSITLQKIVP